MRKPLVPIVISALALLLALLPLPIAGRAGWIHASIGSVVICSFVTLCFCLPAQAWSLWLFRTREGSTRVWMATVASVMCPSVSIVLQFIGLGTRGVGYRGSAPVTTAIIICFLAGAAGVVATIIVNAILCALSRHVQKQESVS